MRVVSQVGELAPYEPPAWVPGRYCPRCTSRRHRSWYAVASCRWRHRLLWCHGNPPSSGPCWATISRCGHPGGREAFVTIILHRTLAGALAAMDMIRHLGCGGSCTRRHELVAMHEGAEVHFDDEPGEVE